MRAENKTGEKNILTISPGFPWSPFAPFSPGFPFIQEQTIQVQVVMYKKGEDEQECWLINSYKIYLTNKERATRGFGLCLIQVDSQVHQAQESHLPPVKKRKTDDETCWSDMLDVKVPEASIWLTFPGMPGSPLAPSFPWGKRQQSHLVCALMSSSELTLRGEHYSG